MYDESENNDLCTRIVLHEFALFETQPSSTMLINYRNRKILIFSQ